MSATLPVRPSLEHLKKQARQLLSRYRRDEGEAAGRFTRNLPGFDGGAVALHDAQSVVAREHGCASWSALREEVRLRVRLPAGEPDHIILVTAAGDTVRPADRHLNCLAFAPGRHSLLSAGMDGRIREWDPASGAELRSVQAHPKSVNTLSFHPDETLLTSGCSDGTAVVHGWPSLETVAALTPKMGASSVFAPLGDRILTVGLNGRAYLWTWPGLDRVAEVRLGKKVVARAFTPDAEHVLLSSLDGALVRVRLSDGETESLRDPGGAPIVSMAFVPGNDRLVVIEYGVGARLLDAALETVAKADIGAPGVYTLRFHPSEDVFALCIEHGVQVRRSSDLSLLGTLDIPAKGVYALAFSPDDQWLAVAGADQRIRVWRMV